MSANWLYNIKHVVPGESVEAGVVSRPDRTLEERTDYLKDRLDAAELGRALFDMDATIAGDVLPGQPVFWNYATHRYEKALAAVEADPTSQALVMQPSSDCVGICYKKKAADRADIVLRGIVELPELTNAIGLNIAPGRYYLSAVEPGKLVQQRPPVTVYVCYVQGPKDNCADVPRVVVMPHVRDFIDEHTHYRFDLVCRPAGTVTTATVDGVDHVRFTDSNPNLQGWLPVKLLDGTDNPIFAGKAPAGALFGYNLSKHLALSRCWPPLPIQSVAMLWDKGVEHVGATEIPLGRDGLAVCDVNGIWWMSDCVDDVPWPATITEPPETPPVAECPRDEFMRLAVVYIRMLVGNDRSVVTSLEPAYQSPIEVVNCDNLPAKTGDLKLDLSLQTIDCQPLGLAFGGKVFNEVVDKHKLKKSWVTEGIVAHNLPQLTVTGHWQRTLTNQEKLDLELPVNETVYAQQGLVKFEFDNQYADREIAPQIVRLNDAVERLYKDIPYLGLPSSQESSLRMRFNVPYVNLQDNTGLRLKIRVQLFGRGGALSGSPTALPPLVMTHRILPAPGNTPIPLVPESEESQLVWPSDAQTISLLRDQAVEKDSNDFAVSPGDTVLVTLQRPYSANDTYAEIGILRVSGIMFKTNTPS